MIQIPEYTTDRQIYEGTHSIVYRGHRNSDELPVVIKVLKREYPLPIELARFKREFEMTNMLENDGIITAYGLEKSGNTLAIILEDFGGDALSKLLFSSPSPHTLNLTEIITLAIDITDALGQVHSKNLIHKDINPSNIIWNPDTGQIKIIDFGISTQLPRETPAISTINVLEGTLAYMSPEQTGRMNRSMDYRTDLYSLGITLYEMVTGHPPFTTKDPMELVHSHIARLPIPPDEINPEIPKPISDIIMKLTSKMAEERYQSIFGLKHDLVQCLNFLQDNESGNIRDYEIGQKDISDRLRIPQKLYGRQTEIETLLTGFEDVKTGGCKLVLVTGHAGIGKTALVHEVQRPLIQKTTASSKTEKCYFISGKFDQLKKSVPYAPLIQAFKQLIHHLLAETDEQVAAWKEKLMNALGPNGQVIVDVIPDVELIIGKQPSAPELGPMENMNRFNYVFENFITTFASEEHPLVVFLDDLQWADSASLKLIELFITVKAEYLYLIGAYRDNEVDAAHPLMMTIEEIRKNGAVVEHLNLQPIKQSHVNQLISETFFCDPEHSEPLAALCHSKTRGNPFFLTQFIHSLYRERLIEFNGTLGIWEWNEDKIRQTEITDNVVELMVKKIQKLSGNAVQILSLAACIGNRFDLNILSIVYGKSTQQTAEDLINALQEELIVPLDDSYKYVSEPDQITFIPVYRFLHDRVQQAAYSLIEEEHRAEVHLKIGREMLKATSEEELDDGIFMIVDQLNLSAELIKSEAEKNQIAQLNLVAGKKAKLSGAYNPAFDYLQSGMKMLQNDCWQMQYELTLALHEETTETAFLCGDYEKMDHLTERVFQNAKTVLDTIRFYEHKIQACFSQHKLQEAVKTGLYALKLVGENYPQKPNKLQILLAFWETKMTLLGRETDTLIHLREMTDPYKLAAMRILISMSSAAFVTAPELVPLLAFKGLTLSVRHGNSPASIFIYNSYGAILCGVIGNIKLGYTFGNLALQLSNKLNAKLFESRTELMFNLLIRHWKKSIQETLNPLAIGFQRGLETGDFSSAGSCAIFYSNYSYFAGIKLFKLDQESLKYNESIKKIRQHTSLHYNERRRQVTLNLMGYNEHQTTITGDVFDEKKMYLLYQKTNDRSGIAALYLDKLILCYFFGKCDNAIECATIAKKQLIALMSMISYSIFYFYDSLAHLAIFSESTNIGKIRILLKINKNQKKMKKWAHHAPMNHLHKWQLVEAEKARILGKYKKAMELYDLAIAGAHENQYIQEEALAYELAAKFYLSKGKTLIAHAYMTEARYRYLKWGALAKVKHLDDTYPKLLDIPSRSENEQSTEKSPTTQAPDTIQTIQTIQPSTTTTSPSKTGKGSQKLDLNTIMKSSQTISGEIRFDKLLEKMMGIVIENAGAQKGILLLEKDGLWFIEGQGRIDQQEVTSMQSIPLDSIKAGGDPSLSLLLPATIVQYVIHTQEPLILNTAFHENQFSADPYIVKNRPKSILCVPILHQTRLIGIGYLENNLTEGAFTPDRLEVLRLLSSQIAISIQNARLYANLEELVEERTHELSQTLEDLKTTQNQLVESEKMAALGQLIAGIAHEINTPLGVIRASAGNMLDGFNEAIPQLTALFDQLTKEKLVIFFKLVEKAVEKKLPLTAREERKFRKELTSQLEAENVDDADDIADTLVDMGIIREIQPFMPILKEKNAPFFVRLAYSLSGQQRNSNTILTAVERASKTVFALKNYAHYDRSGEMIMANLFEGIETVLTLYHNQIKQGVEVIVRGFEDIPVIPCYPDELNQVWTNLIHNALQAMEHKGKLEIEARQGMDEDQNGEYVIINFTDSGCGIPEENLERIFEPFFTTKSTGEGSGLGLEICKRIVEKHHGRISVSNEPGRTTFKVCLLKQNLFNGEDTNQKDMSN